MIAFRFLAGVICNVPAGAFELNRRRRNLPFQLAAAGAALRRRLIAHLLEDLDMCFALFTFKLVDRHDPIIAGDYTDFKSGFFPRNPRLNSSVLLCWLGLKVEL